MLLDFVAVCLFCWDLLSLVVARVRDHCMSALSLSLCGHVCLICPATMRRDGLIQA